MSVVVPIPLDQFLYLELKCRNAADKCASRINIYALFFYSVVLYRVAFERSGYLGFVSFGTVVLRWSVLLANFVSFVCLFKKRSRAWALACERRSRWIWRFGVAYNWKRFRSLIRVLAKVVVVSWRIWSFVICIRLNSGQTLPSPAIWQSWQQ